MFQRLLKLSVILVTSPLYLGIRTRVSNIFVSLKIPNFSVLRRKLVYNMYKRVLASSDRLVRILLDSNYFVTSRIFKQWMQILFSNYVC